MQEIKGYQKTFTGLTERKVNAIRRQNDSLS